MPHNQVRKTEAKFVIDEDTIMAEIAERYPEIADFLVQEYGFHCIGCPLSFGETLFEGAMVHGLTVDEKEELLDRVNSMIK